MFTPKSLDSILANFNRIYDQLDAHFERKSNESYEHKAAATEAGLRAEVASMEASKAAKIRDRIKEFTTKS